MVFLYMKCFGFKISCRNLKSNCVTTDLDFEDKFDVVFKIDDFSNQFLGKKKDLLFNGKLWIHRFCKKKVPKGSEEWSIVETLFWSEPKDLWGGG